MTGNQFDMIYQWILVSFKSTSDRCTPMVRSIKKVLGLKSKKSLWKFFYGYFMNAGFAILEMGLC